MAIRPELVFRIASLTKQITAVAVLMLVAQGKLSLTDQHGRIFIQPTGGVREEAVVASQNELVWPRSLTRFRVVSDAAGAVTALEWQDRQGPVRIYRKTDKPLPSARPPVAVASAVYDAYAGEYRIGPYAIQVFHEEGTLRAQAPGDVKRTLIPDAETTFLLEQSDIAVEFQKDQRGAVSGLVAHVGDQAYACKKIG